mmetsp:Transcript_129343/g.374569  ORF Transcript_129343/g.374569 Transcript_129343/m.374569 type:complete len:208 (+) Transcript_129343:2380-3003(+)
MRPPYIGQALGHREQRLRAHLREHLSKGSERAPERQQCLGTLLVLYGPGPSRPDTAWREPGQAGERQVRWRGKGLVRHGPGEEPVSGGFHRYRHGSAAGLGRGGEPRELGRQHFLEPARLLHRQHISRSRRRCTGKSHTKTTGCGVFEERLQEVAVRLSQSGDAGSAREQQWVRQQRLTSILSRRLYATCATRIARTEAPLGHFALT